MRTILIATTLLVASFSTSFAQMPEHYNPGPAKASTVAPAQKAEQASEPKRNLRHQQSAPDLSPDEMAQLNALLLKKAAQILPSPSGVVGTMTQTAKVGTPPSGRGCRKLVGTKHDDASHGTYQIWGPC